MRRKKSFVVCFATAACCVFISGHVSAREVVDGNFAWKFHRADGDSAVFSATSFDDREWRLLDLPHDYQIEQPWAEPTDEQKRREKKQQPFVARGFKELSIGWYRKDLKIDPDWKGKRVLLDVGGIMYVGDVWLNGKKVGSNEYGYLGGEYDLTEHLDWGGRNVVAIRADNTLHSRWYTGGGLYRKVHLVVKEPVSIARHGVFVSTPEITGRQASVKVQVELDNLSGKSRQVTLAIRLLSPAGKPVAKGKAGMQVKGISATSTMMLNVSEPQLWSTETPNLYTAEVTVKDAGNVLDRISERFGIRTVEWKPEQGIVLNGKRI